MDLVFCTLFDSNYIDKGITLYRSMEQCMEDFRLYIFAFDQKCFDILKAEDYPHAVIVPLEEFETAELLEAKKTRTRAEYCWTCTPWTIRHVLERYHEKICTYIDADMRFFSSPQSVFDQMHAQDKSVIIVSHGYADEASARYAFDRTGVYCVEFNTFVNDENGSEALSWWAERCLEWCYYAVPGTTEWYGDQKYLNVFPEKFKGVMVCDHFGVGFAPWNIKLAEYVRSDDGVPVIRHTVTGREFPVVLYHFENVTFLTPHILHVSSRTDSRELHRSIYDVYVKELMANRKYVEKKYRFKISKAKRVVTKNPLMAAYQRFISPFKRVKHLYDLYWIG